MNAQSEITWRSGNDDSRFLEVGEMIFWANLHFGNWKNRRCAESLLNWARDGELHFKFAIVEAVKNSFPKANVRFIYIYLHNIFWVTLIYNM